jgi:hypothetical protein
MQVFNPRSGLCDDQKNVEGCEETYPDEPRELDIEVGELFLLLLLFMSGVYILVENRYLFPPPLRKSIFFPPKTA